MPTEANLAPTIRAMIANILALEEDEVTPDSRFFADLGGESIELLELTFQLEKQLGCRVDFNRLIGSDDLQRDAQGIVTPASLAALATRYPFLPLARLKAQPTAEDLKDLLTVDVITRLVELTPRESAPTAGAPHPA
jgi:acyl carrier protein